MMGGINLITTVIGFGMSATFIVFVCTRIICGRLRAAESRPNYDIESRIDLEQTMGGLRVSSSLELQSRASGLEPVLVAAIPTMKFHKEAFSTIEDAQCSICLGEYQDKEVLRIMPKCGHNFHLSCIDVWLRKQSTCPVCRLPLQDSFDSKHVRPVTVSRDETVDESETSTDHSQHWLLPGPHRSEGNTSDEARPGSVSVSLPVLGETEIRR